MRYREHPFQNMPKLLQALWLKAARERSKLSSSPGSPTPNPNAPGLPRCTLPTADDPEDNTKFSGAAARASNAGLSC